MAEESGSQQSANLWPLPQFTFSVTIHGIDCAFQEVSGLEVESQVIEYRHGNSPVFSAVKMPGLQKYGNVTLKKGVFKNDDRFWNWLNTIKMNSVPRTTATIRLLDTAGKATMTWALAKAWPTKISSTDLKSDGNEVAVESIELAHEGLTLGAGGAG